LISLFTLHFMPYNRSHRILLKKKIMFQQFQLLVDQMLAKVAFWMHWLVRIEQ